MSKKLGWMMIRIVIGRVILIMITRRKAIVRNRIVIRESLIGSTILARRVMMKGKNWRKIKQILMSRKYIGDTLIDARIKGTKMMIVMMSIFEFIHLLN